MKILHEKNNTLLKRKEMTFLIEAPTNPGYETSKKSIAEKTKAHEQTIAVKSVRNNFGTNQFIVEAFVYTSEEQKNKIEPKVKAKKAAGSQ